MPDPTDEPAQQHHEPDLTPLGRLLDMARSSAGRSPTTDAHAAVEELFPQRPELVEYMVRFAALIVLSASIAAFGLLANSAGVVIGAMLVAPLMTPILAAAAATVRANNRELLSSLAIITLGTALAVATGYIVGIIAGDTISGTVELPAELAARTYPTLLDLGVAVSAGAAAGYIVPRRSAVAALPGVGIAVALVPPLATVGITWQLDRPTDAWNAMLLFLTNLAAIVFSASIMLIIAGFRPRVKVSRKVLTARVLITLTAVTVVAIPLSLHTRASLEDSQLNLLVSQSVKSWDQSAQVVSLTAQIRGGVAHVELLVTGPNDPDEIWRIAERIHDRSGHPVEMDLRYQQDDRFQVTAR